MASDASVNALKQARGEGQFKDIHQKMKALRQKARAIATPEQVQSLAQFDPRPAGGPDGEVEEGGYGGPEKGAGPGHQGMHGPMDGKHPHQHQLMVTAVSPEFIALVEARAR